MTTQYKALLLLLASGTVFADPNLQVSFVNTDPPSSNQCSANPLPTASTFNVVITDIDAKDPTVSIGSVTFNGHNGAEGTTGSPNIIGNSNSPTEQKYLLHSCNGKQLSYHQSCTIPMVFNYGTTPITTSTTLTVGAETDVTQGNYSTASFTVGNGIQNQGLTIAFYNVSNSSYGGYTSDNFGPSAFMPSGSSEHLTFNGGGRLNPSMAVFNYTITNNSSVTKTVATRCVYGTQYTPYAGAISNSGTCDGVQLLPKQSCTATLNIGPAGAGASCNSVGQEKTACYASVSNILSVYDATSTVAVGAPESINGESLSFGWILV